MPAELAGGRNLGFMFLPNYRAWVIVFSLAVCLTTWYVIERTRLGSYLRAATEKPRARPAFGSTCPDDHLDLRIWRGLAALAGVLAAPIYQVNPLMGADLIIVRLRRGRDRGLGSIMGSIVTGFGLGWWRVSRRFLPRGLQHGDLRDHGGRATAAARGLFGRAS